MKSKCSSLLAVAIILLAGVVSLSVHHSISAEFDLEKRVTVAGVVTRVEWMNPHTYFYVDAANPKTHKIENWAFQLNNPKALRVLGWNQDSLKVGDVITATGSPSLSGSRAVYTREIRFQNGRKFNAELQPSASAPQ